MRIHCVQNFSSSLLQERSSKIRTIYKDIVCKLQYVEFIQTSIMIKCLHLSVKINLDLNIIGKKKFKKLEDINHYSMEFIKSNIIFFIK